MFADMFLVVAAGVALLFVLILGSASIEDAIRNRRN